MDNVLERSRSHPQTRHKAPLHNNLFHRTIAHAILLKFKSTARDFDTHLGDEFFQGLSSCIDTMTAWEENAGSWHDANSGTRYNPAATFGRIAVAALIDILTMVEHRVPCSNTFFVGR